MFFEQHRKLTEVHVHHLVTINLCQHRKEDCRGAATLTFLSSSFLRWEEPKEFVP